MNFLFLRGLENELLLETLRSNDADDNENVKKIIGLISKTTTFFVHFFPVFARLRRENA